MSKGVEKNRVHRRQGREAARRRQQDQRRQGEEPPRRDRGRRYAHQEAILGSFLGQGDPAPAAFSRLDASRIRRPRRRPPATPIRELAKFSVGWPTAGGIRSEFRPLHQINPLRLDWIDRLRAAGRQRVLDVGCGGGILSDSMARRGANGRHRPGDKPLWASPAARDGGGHGVGALPRGGGRGAGSESPAAFDVVVTCMEMLEHVPDPASVVRACSTWSSRAAGCSSRPSTATPVGVPVRHRRRRARAATAAGTHEYARFIRPSELVGWCRDAGLDATATRGLDYQPDHAPLRLVGRHQRQLHLIACRKAA